MPSWKRLWAQLFTRNTRNIRLTEFGAEFLPHAQALLAESESLFVAAKEEDEMRGTVRINASQHAIDEVLLPKLAGFGQQYPDVKLELISENRFVDIIGEQFDAGVRLGDEVDEGMVAVRIAPDMEMAVVGTPEHYRRYGFPQTPQDLSAPPCIAYQFANGGLYHWEFTYEGRAFKHSPVGQWVFNDAYVEAAAARAGLGLAYVPVAMVAEALENGRLIRVLKPFSHIFPGWYLYYPHRNVSPALRRVIDVLKVA